MPLVVGQSYSSYIEITGATSASVTSGSLPSGITGSLNTGTGRYNLSGTPTTAGSYSFTITANNECGTGGATGSTSLPFTVTVADFSPQVALTFYFNHTLSLMARDINNVQPFLTRYLVGSTYNYNEWTTRTNESFIPLVSGISQAALGSISGSVSTTVLSIAVGIDDFAESPVGTIKNWINLLWENTDSYEYANQNIGNVAVEYGAGIGVWNVQEGLSTFNGGTSVTVENGVGGVETDYATIAHCAFIPGNWRATTIYTPSDATIVNGNGGYPVSSALGLTTNVSKIAEYTVTIPAYSFILVTASTAIYYYTLNDNPTLKYHQFFDIPAGCSVAYERVFDDSGYSSILSTIICNLSSSQKTVKVKLPSEITYSDVDPEGNPITGLTIDRTLGKQCGIFVFEPMTQFNTVIPKALIGAIPGAGGGAGGGGGSVWVQAYMPGSEKRAGQFMPGDALLLLNEERNGTKAGEVISNRLSEQNLLTLVSASGIELTCSDNTPLTLEDGSSIQSPQALGHKLPVQDENGFRWEEITEVRAAGRGMVATIYCKDQCYAAGNEPNRWIWTHNVFSVK